MVTNGLAHLLHDDIETVAANSFRNFHAKGLDYLCLLRTPGWTVKAYFYDKPDSSGPEVVCPHDHRYQFATTIVAGESGHQRYSRLSGRGREGRQFSRFQWRTPLNGGDGFKYDGRTRLWLKEPETYRAGQTYWCEPDEIHTIRIDKPNTILLLQQFADLVPLDAPTSTFVPGENREPPSLDGLYDRMTIDHAISLIARLNGEAAHG